MNNLVKFEINKFNNKPILFTDLDKIVNIDKIIKILPKNSTIIVREYNLNQNRDICKKSNFSKKQKN